MSTSVHVTPAASSRAQARREEILSAACRLFAEKGYDAVSTRELAAAAGCSEALIFRYFSSKSALYEVLFDEYYEIIKLPVVLPPLPGETGRAWLERFDRVIPNYKKNLGRPGLADAVTSRTERKGALNGAYEEASDIISDLLIPIFRQGQADGTLPVTDCTKAASLYWAIYAGINILQTGYPSSAQSFPDLAEIIRAVCTV